MASRAMAAHKKRQERIMRLKTSLLTLFAALILTAGGAGAATAGVIDTTPSWKLDGSSFTSPTFGNGSSTPSPTNLGDTATYGEVVTASGNVLKNFTFYMEQNNFLFEGYVYAWDGLKATGPRLWQSGAMHTMSSTAPQAVTFSPGITVESGSQYVLFASVSEHYTSNGGGGGQWEFEWNAGTPSDYFVFDNNEGDPSLWTTATWDSLSTIKSYNGVPYGTKDTLSFKAEFDVDDTSSGSVPLSVGWNLISLPAEPVSPAITSVLSDLQGLYQVVWAYPDQTWQVFDPNDAAGSTLTAMHAGIGYWIKMTAKKTLSLSGAAPSSPLLLLQGWNLVGYKGGTLCNPVPSAVSPLSLSSNFLLSWGYPSQGWQFYDPNNSSSGLATLCPGAGYWVEVNQAATFSWP
jgi:hypothetical protein